MVQEITLVTPINGSFFEINGIQYRYTNTCSIDYFILFIAIVFNYNKNIVEMKDSKWKTLCESLKNNIFNKNSWDLARYYFLSFERHIKACNQDKNSCSIDCFLSEYDAYMNIYNKLKTYRWEISCNHCYHRNFGESCSLSLRFVFYSKN